MTDVTVKTKQREKDRCNCSKKQVKLEKSDGYNHSRSEDGVKEREKKEHGIGEEPEQEQGDGALQSSTVMEC